MAESMLPTETLTVLEESPTFEEDSIPTDVLVQRQLQDVILTQKSVIERLSDDVSQVCLLSNFLCRGVASNDTFHLYYMCKKRYYFDNTNQIWLNLTHGRNW